MNINYHFVVLSLSLSLFIWGVCVGHVKIKGFSNSFYFLKQGKSSQIMTELEVTIGPSGLSELDSWTARARPSLS